MPLPTGQPLDALESPQLLLDLDVLDANLRTLQDACRQRGVNLRVHFKSLKCGGLAKYLRERGVSSFLAAKLNEAEVLADAGITDILLANQVVGPVKLRRLAALARRTQVLACVDDADNVRQMNAAAGEAGSTWGALVEVDVGMNRCGVEPGQPALELARLLHAQPHLRFAGLQGYDGHLQLLPPGPEKDAQSRASAEQLVATAKLIEKAGIPVGLVTGAGTGTWQAFSSVPGVTEIQPGSFLLMDCAYQAVRPEFGCSLSILSTVISRRPGWYVLDAGSKAISKDFGMPQIQGRPQERVVKLSEEHTRVEVDSEPPKVGERRRVIPAHCCATMNLHRTCVAVRGDRVEAVWPIEASGRYD